MNRTQIEAWCRLRFDNLYQTLIESRKLPSDVLLAIINEILREISKTCGLIPACLHWAAVADQNEYPLLSYPELFIQPYHPTDYVYFNKVKLIAIDPHTTHNLSRIYTSSGTPYYAAIDQRSYKKFLTLIPAPDVSAGGTGSTPKEKFDANPIHIYIYRLPKPIEATNGEPEIVGSLHDLLKQGVQAMVADILDHPKAGVWLADYQMKLAEAAVAEGIRERPIFKVGNIFASAKLGEETTWTGAID